MLLSYRTTTSRLLLCILHWTSLFNLYIYLSLLTYSYSRQDNIRALVIRELPRFLIIHRTRIDIPFPRFIIIITTGMRDYSDTNRRF